MSRLKFVTANRKTKDNERAVLPTILYCGEKADWGDVKGSGFGLMIGWWAWGVGFIYVKAREL